MRESICRGCGRKIYWAKSVSGKSMPLEFIPGIVRVTDPDKLSIDALPEGFPFTLADIAEQRRKGGALAEPTVQGHFAVNHFVTCPKREEFKTNES